ncbi:MAG: MauE/DoxX family redox-associated membrane protein [Acidimicrobiales bacterium]
MVGSAFGHGAGFGYVCAVVLAGVFVGAGVSKAARPAGTVAGFVALGVPGAPVVARALPAVEIALAVALLSFPRIGGVAALVTLGAFSAFLARAVRAGVTAGCNCFGRARADPVSGHDLVRNAMLAALAAAAILTARPVVPSLVATAVAVAVVVAGVAVLRATSNP